MPIHQKTPRSEISKYLQEQIILREKVVVNVLNRIGMECITEARDNGSYIDQTGNLRSSIGYAILKNGNVMKQSSFTQVKEGSSGSVSGQAFIQELMSSQSGGIFLIVVAGMNYAAHVETRRNVLASSEILASRLVPKLLRQLGFIRK